MDDGLVLTPSLSLALSRSVLILVVMDDGLVLSKEQFDKMATRLNPCCNGRWSRTSFQNPTVLLQKVLILVVMDDGLVLVLLFL